MRRRLVAGALTVLVPIASLLGLFVHEHPGDHDSHHDAREIHSHFNGHPHAGHHELEIPAGVPTAGDEGEHERAVYLGAIVADATAAVPLVAVLCDAVEVVTPAERPAQPPLHVVHGHDPPLLASAPARAPPSLPVLI